MNLQRAERVQSVLGMVLRQVTADAGIGHVTVAGEDAAASFVRQICVSALGAGAIQSDGLRLHPVSKTALLLGTVPAADILLLGDLYYSQVVELAGSAATSASLTELAEACGGFAALDRALARYYDGRQPWESAVGDLPSAVRPQLRQQLEAARFRRARVGLVPKLGARTLGIDLYA